jgi:hypothetical protein
MTTKRARVSIVAGKYTRSPMAVYGTRDGGETFTDYTLLVSPIDMLGSDMEPRPLYSERRDMERMRPSRLGAYLVLRAVYFALPDRIRRTPLVLWLWRSLTPGRRAGWRRRNT